DGRDLRLLIIVVRGLYNLEGYAGLAQGLELLRASVAQFWDSLHPGLRERDDVQAAALPRLNALRQLENDDNGLLGDLRFGTVLNPRGLGPVSGNDLAAGSQSEFDMLNKAAKGLSQAERDALVAKHGQRVNRVTGVVRALAAEEGARAAEMIAALKACDAGIGALIAAVDTAGGFGGQTGLSLSELSSFLGQCRSTLEKAVATTAGAAAPETEDAPAPGVTAQEAPAARVNGAAAPGTINSRGDVESALDRIIGFYERTEPSSPIPHLARRMRRMVAMDFIELMEEIAPSGLKEFRSAAGVEEPKKK
uniref:type VI secretion system protein TssA n=1 Tax=Puniceibacterium confluentis TaxID=1958944 RepID=UPI003566A0C7